MNHIQLQLTPLVFKFLTFHGNRYTEHVYDDNTVLLRKSDNNFRPKIPNKPCAVHDNQTQSFKSSRQTTTRRQFQNQLTELKLLVLYLFNSHHILLPIRTSNYFGESLQTFFFFYFESLRQPIRSLLLDLFRVLNVTRKTVNERYIFPAHVNNPRPKFRILGHSLHPDGFFVVN